MEVRWGDVPDWTGPPRDAYCLTTALTMKPPHLVACDTQRWAIETTVQACREDLQLEATQGDGRPTVLRFTPGLFGLSPLGGRLSLQLPRPSDTLSAVFWRGQSPVTFSEMMTCVRRA